MNIKGNKQINDKMAMLSSNIETITLRFNGINTSIKKQRLVAWIKKRKTQLKYLLFTKLKS